MVIDTKTMLRMLPFETAFKDEMLKNFDDYDTSNKFKIAEIIWDAYYSFYQHRLEENMDAAFERADKEQEILDENFYKRARELTDKQMQEELITTTTQIDLSSTRQKLEEIMNTALGS